MRQLALLLSICFCCMFLLTTICAGQEDELELMDTVARLQKQLRSADVPKREEAEKELLELGPEILGYLESADDDSTTDYRERMTRIRRQLEKTAVNQVSKASRISMAGKMSVGNALQRIKKMTGNNVVVSDPSFADIEIEVEFRDIQFWEAITELMNKSNLVIDPYGASEPGQISLTRGAENRSTTRLPASANMIFQTQVTRVDSSVNLLQTEFDYSTITLLVRWEPRLRPISVDIPMSSVTIVDEYDDKIEPKNPEEVVYGMVQPEIPQVEFSLSLPRIDRQIESLEKLQMTIDTLLPGKTEQFRFRKIGTTKPGFSIQKAGATVEFGGTRKNEDVYSVQMSISFDEENNALESHQGWVFQNEVYLTDQKGNKEEAISMETLQQDNEKVTIQYYFLEPPGDRTLVYNTPATIIKLPVQIELSKIPLP